MTKNNTTHTSKQINRIPSLWQHRPHHRDYQMGFLISSIAILHNPAPSSLPWGTEGFVAQCQGTKITVSFDFLFLILWKDGSGVCVCVFAFVCLYVFICVYLCFFICVFMLSFVCIYAFIFFIFFVSVCIRVFMWVYLCFFICVYLCFYFLCFPLFLCVFAFLICVYLLLYLYMFVCDGERG